MRRAALCAAAAAALAVGVPPATAPANETDQFTLPLDRPFADLGPYFTAVHYRVLESAVARLNDGIDRVRWMSDEQQRRAELRQYHDPAVVASAVRYQFLPGFIDTIAMENALLSGLAAEAFPGCVVAHKQPDWIYLFAHLPIDPRNLALMFQSSTIKVYGSYMGTDKIAHFHDLGHIYYLNYLRRVRAGMSEEEATAWVVNEFANGPISEGAIIGLFASGVFSNADLASNYVGMKFYRNLTEPVVVKGELRPPMLVLVGDHWALNHHVRPESDFFEPFVSDHFNEALNPSLFEWGLRREIQRRITRNAANIVTFYAERDGRPRDIAYFDNLARELGTYYGEDYGGRGEVGVNLLSVGSTCLASLEGIEPPAAGTGTATATAQRRGGRSAPLPEWVRGMELGSRPLAEAEWIRGRRLIGEPIEVARAAPPAAGGEEVPAAITVVGGGRGLVAAHGDETEEDHRRPRAD